MIDWGHQLWHIWTVVMCSWIWYRVGITAGKSAVTDNAAHTMGMKVGAALVGIEDKRKLVGDGNDIVITRTVADWKANGYKWRISVEQQPCEEKAQ